MKLLAQFYACLAIIVFIAVIGGIEARSSSTFMTAGNRGGLLAAQEPGDHPEQPSGQQSLNRQRRSYPGKDENPENFKEAEKPSELSRKRRHQPEEKDLPQKPQAEEGPEEHHQRHRRQMPKMPSQDEMAKHIPKPAFN